MALDKLRFHNILVQEMNVPPETAERLTEAVSETTANLVTTADIALLQSELLRADDRLRADIHAEINRLLRWLFTSVIAIGGTIIALLVFLISRL